MLRSAHTFLRINPLLVTPLQPSLRLYKSAPSTLTEKKKRERMEKHLQKQKQIKESALTQKQQLVKFQELTNETPPYVIRTCFIPTIFQFLLCGSVYLNTDFFTPANTNSIVAMSHIFAQNIFVFSAAIVGYETTRTAIPEQALAEQRYKPQVKLQGPLEQQARGLLISKKGSNIVAISVVLSGIGLTWIDGLSPFALLPFLLNGFLLKYYSLRQAWYGLLPSWVFNTVKFNSLFIIVQVFLLLVMIMARMVWVKRMQDESIAFEVKIEEKLEGRVLSQEEKQKIQVRQDTKINELSGFTNLWK